MPPKIRTSSMDVPLHSCAISPSLAAGLCIHSETEGGFGMNQNSDAIPRSPAIVLFCTKTTVLFFPCLYFGALCQTQYVMSLVMQLDYFCKARQNTVFFSRRFTFSTHLSYRSFSLSFLNYRGKKCIRTYILSDSHTMLKVLSRSVMYLYAGNAQCSGKPIFFPVPVFTNFCIL